MPLTPAERRAFKSSPPKLKGTWWSHPSDIQGMHGLLDCWRDWDDG